MSLSSTSIKKKNYPVETKVVILGTVFVGKTSFVNVLIDRVKDNINTSPTIGASYSAIKTDDCKISIFDTGGQERFATMRPIYYRNANIIIVMYSLIEESSFEKAINITKEVINNHSSSLSQASSSQASSSQASSQASSPTFSQASSSQASSPTFSQVFPPLPVEKPVFIIVANKQDLIESSNDLIESSNDLTKSKKVFDDLLQDYKHYIFECSTKTFHNMDEIKQILLDDSKIIYNQLYKNWQLQEKIKKKNNNNNVPINMNTPSRGIIEVYTVGLYYKSFEYCSIL